MTNDKMIEAVENALRQSHHENDLIFDTHLLAQAALRAVRENQWSNPNVILPKDGTEVLAAITCGELEYSQIVEFSLHETVGEPEDWVEKMVEPTAFRQIENPRFVWAGGDNDITYEKKSNFEGVYGYGSERTHKLTHWMPLPTPPAEKDK